MESLGNIMASGSHESAPMIRNQFADMLDSDTGRDSIFVGKYSENPIGTKLPEGVFMAEDPIGTFYTTNLDKAEQFRANPSSVGDLLGYNQPKNPNDPDSKVVAAFDKLGNLQHLEATNVEQAPHVRMKYHNSGYPSSQVASPEEGIMMREQENQRLRNIYG